MLLLLLLRARWRAPVVEDTGRRHCETRGRWCRVSVLGCLYCCFSSASLLTPVMLEPQKGVAVLLLLLVQEHAGHVQWRRTVRPPVHRGRRLVLLWLLLLGRLSMRLLCCGLRGEAREELGAAAAARRRQWGALLRRRL